MKRFLVTLLAFLAIGSAFAQMKAPLTIVSNVMDADLYINNKLYTKTTPNLVIQLPPGNFSIKVAKAGFSEFSATVAVKAGGTTLNVTLQPLAAAPAQVAPAQTLLPSFPLNVTSNAPGAIVTLNGKQVGTTPFGTNVIGGSYEIRVSAPGYSEFVQRVTVKSPTTVNAQLQSAGAQLSVSSNVVGADVFINGNPAGKTPFASQVPQGSYTILVRAPGYLDFSQNVVVNGPVQVNANLQGQSQQLSVQANVIGADVFINGNPAGKTPFAGQLPSGSYTILVRAAGYLDFNQNIVVGSGPAQVNAMLQSLSFQVNVNANVNGAAVFINGSQVGQTPFFTTLPQGGYTVLVRAPGYTDYQVQVAVNGPQSIVASLQPMMATWQLKLPDSILTRDSNNNRDKNKSSPSGIQVWVDGALQPDAPGPVAAAGQLLPGRHTIRVLAGGMVAETQFDAQAGRAYVIEPTLGLTVK